VLNKASSIFSIPLGTASSLYNYLIIEFDFKPDQSTVGEPLFVRCFDEASGLKAEIGYEKWEIGSEYRVNGVAFYAVTQCKIANVAKTRNVMIEFKYEAKSTKTSMTIDSIKITGLAAAKSEVAIFKNQNFESGYGSIFKDGGDDSLPVTYSNQASFVTKNPSGGNALILLRDNSGTKSSMFTAGQDVAGYSALRLEFDFYVQSFEKGENFLVEWKIPGLTFITEERWIYQGTGGIPIVLNKWERASVTFDTWVSAGKPKTIDLRIQANATADDDRLYIDNVIFIGIY
jgi:hypothetical protein